MSYDNIDSVLAAKGLTPASEQELNISQDSKQTMLLSRLNALKQTPTRKWPGPTKPILNAQGVKT